MLRIKDWVLISKWDTYSHHATKAVSVRGRRQGGKNGVHQHPVTMAAFTRTRLPNNLHRSSAQSQGQTSYTGVVGSG